MVLNFASWFSTVKLRKTKNIEVQVYNSIPLVYTFTTIQRYQQPNSFSAFISWVSSTVRLNWDITQIEEISLVHTSNRDCVNIKSATWHHSEARFDYTNIVELTLLFYSLVVWFGVSSDPIQCACAPDMLKRLIERERFKDIDRNAIGRKCANAKARKCVF